MGNRAGPTGGRSIGEGKPVPRWLKRSSPLLIDSLSLEGDQFSSVKPVPKVPSMDESNVAKPIRHDLVQPPSYHRNIATLAQCHHRELIDQVIDHLHDDLPSLRVCCIACRAWAASAQFHIFHDIVLSTEHTNALQVLVLLENSPHIFALVRSLTIKGHPGNMYDTWPDYLDVVIPPIAPKLTRLKSLRVHCVTLAQQDPKVLSALIHSFSTLQELSIIAVTFNRFRDFAALIVEHPFLKCLDLGDIRWNDLVTPTNHWENLFQQYPDLRSRLRSPWAIVKRFWSLPVSKFPLWKLSSPVEAILGKIETDLLSSNTQLHTLTIDNLLLFQTSSKSYAWVPVLLSQVTSCYMEEISFILILNEVKAIEKVYLELVQDIITQPVFSGVKRVSFRLIGPLDPVEVSQAIRARMHQLDEMGLLVFCHEKVGT
ncbi:hypothetical protein JB92DRAFT_2836471 [Gautieria morchelliformis]|nr:hypothetical protein JB92DRAFT_2836471 [Gautieria morchelliformis]